MQIMEDLCLDYYIGLCKAPCVGYISKQELMVKVIQDAIDLLSRGKIIK